ncbi:MAG: CDP-alcohol phosphatidyltransferase family protein [Patescibacteria group bacterium]
MTDNKFTRNADGDKSIFSNYEKKFADKYAPKIPKVLETDILTYFSLAWTFFILLFGYLGSFDLRWFWLVSLMIVFHYLTDMFDGAVGRYRQTGLIRWGYFMDHMLDFIYLNSIFISYAFIFSKDSHLFILAIMAIFGAFFVNSHLSFSATEEFKITYLRVGPTEIQLSFVILNIIIIFTGSAFIEKFLPFFVAASLIALFGFINKTQDKIWKIDVENKLKGK